MTLSAESTGLYQGRDELGRGMCGLWDARSGETVLCSPFFLVSLGSGRGSLTMEHLRSGDF